MKIGLKPSDMISVRDAARIAEKAYRRGVQQGVIFHQEGLIHSHEELIKWRYPTWPSLRHLDVSKSPIKGDPFKTTSLQRFEWECDERVEVKRCS